MNSGTKQPSTPSTNWPSTRRINWKTDKTWSDQFIPQIKQILGECLIGEATAEQDQLQNTDLIMLLMPGSVRIACRVRRHCYLASYADEFTLRCSRPSGRETEIDKLLAGWADYLFYGFANDQETSLAAWMVGDLNVFRCWVDQYRQSFDCWPGELKSNHDGSSRFMTFGIDDIDPTFVVARQKAEDA